MNFNFILKDSLIKISAFKSAAASSVNGDCLSVELLLMPTSLEVCVCSQS